MKQDSSRGNPAATIDAKSISCQTSLFLWSLIHFKRQEHKKQAVVFGRVSGHRKAVPSAGLSPFSKSHRTGQSILHGWYRTSCCTYIDRLDFQPKLLPRLRHQPRKVPDAKLLRELVEHTELAELGGAGDSQLQTPDGVPNVQVTPSLQDG
jgi:hypothetical protein